MPAAGTTAKLSSSLDCAQLPSPSIRRRPTTDRCELPSPLDRTAPPLDRTALPSLPDHDPFRDALLRRIEPLAVAWAAQDAELDAETAALTAAGALTAPAEEEWPGPALGPDSALPAGLDAWPAGLPGPLLDEYIAATAEVPAPDVSRARLRDRAGGQGAAFAAGGVGEMLSPGAALAGFAEAAQAAGLGRLTDDELAGVIRAGRRLSSWASALELAAVGDLMRRREQQEAAGDLHAAEHADAEIAALLTLTGRGASRVLDLAMALRRLPLTARALAAGVIDVHRAAVIADETTGLDDDHAADVENNVLVRAPGQTTSQIRAAARRAALAADPRAARKRQEQAQREARVERWDEHAGTAALAGRDLPPAAVIAADQHISTVARGLRAAGLAGTADQLRAQAFLALLSGTPASSLLPPGQQQPNPAGSGSGPPAEPGVPSQPGTPGNPDVADSPVTGGGPGAAVPSPSPSATAGWPTMPTVAGTVNLTMPLGTWLGLMDTPGEVTGFGPLPAEDSRHLGTAMAASPQTRWCLTLTGEDGRPVAHGCARPGHGPPPPALGPAPSAHGPARSARACESPVHGPAPPDHGPGPPAWLASIEMNWFESTGCTHDRQSVAYRPPPGLQHLIKVRQQACAFPGCRRPASQCDLDHTTPFQHGGLTCECNLAPLCRQHHQAKQTPGWGLEQSSPGVLTWTIPSGRSYSTRPTIYPG